MKAFFCLFGGLGRGDGKNPPRATAGCLLLVLLLALSPYSRGAEYIWVQTNGGTFDWADGANWNLGAAPNSPGDLVYFTNTLAGNQTVRIGAQYQLGCLTFGNGANGTNTFLFYSNGAGSLFFTNTNGPSVIHKPFGTLSSDDRIMVPITLGNTLYASNLTAGGLQFWSLIDEAGSQGVHLVAWPSNTGGFGIYQTNRFSGGLWHWSGVVAVGASCAGIPDAPLSGPLGRGPVTLCGGHLRSSVWVTNATILNPVILASNTLFPAASGETTLTLAGTVTLSNGNRSLQVDQGSIVSGSGVVISGSVVDGGNGLGLIQSGQGRLTLAGSNTYSGGTLVASGALWVSNGAGESNVFALGTGGVTNNSTLVLTATNGKDLVYSALQSAFYGSGTNVVLKPSLGVGPNSCVINGNGGGFKGTWFIGPDAAAGGGKVKLGGAQNSATTNHVFTNATVYLSGTSSGATAFLYGGDTGEDYGQLRLDGTTWTGPVWVAGPMTGAGEGHLGVYAGTGNVAGPLGETVPGAWDIRKSGPSNLILTGTNRFSGTFSVLNGGILVGAPPASSGAGPLGSNATVTVTNTTNAWLDLNGYDARIGRLAGGGTTGGKVLLGNRTLTLGVPDNSDSVFRGVISGSGRVVKIGTNVQFLVGTNTYAGGTLLSNGTLAVGTNSTLGSGLVEIFTGAKRLQLTNGTRLTNHINIYGGGQNNQSHGVIDFTNSGTAYLSNGTITIYGPVVVGGHFAGDMYRDGTVVASNGTPIIHRDGQVTFRGSGSWDQWNVGADTLRLGRSDCLPASSTVGLTWMSTSTIVTKLDLGGYNQTLARITNGQTNGALPLIGNNSTTSDSTLTLTGSTVFSGILRDAISTGTRKLHLTVSGGDLTLIGTNSWSGNTVISGGTLRAGTAGWPGRGGAFGSNSAVILSNSPGSVLDLNGLDQEIGSLAGGGAMGGNVTLGSGTLAIGTAQTDSVYTGIISGAGGIVKTGTGTLTLSASHPFTGPTLVTNGTLLLTGSLASAAVAVSNGGNLCGPGSVSGSVTVGQGGILAPGMPGTNAATFTAGSVVFQNGAKYVMDLDGSGPTNDFLVSSGSLVCGENLIATNITNSTNGSFYTVLSAPSITGNFSGIPDNAFLYQKGRLFQVRYTSTNVTLRDIGNLAPPPELEVTNPAPLAYWNGAAPLAGVATNQDPTLAPPTVQAMTNGGAWVTLGVTNDWAFDPGVTNLNEGTNLFSFRAWLSNGLTNQIAFTNIVDRTAPTAVTLSGGSNPFINRTTVTLTAVDLLALDRIFYTTDGTAPDTNASWVPSGGSVTLTNACTLTVVARDRAGNWGPTNAMAFTMVPNPVGGGSIGAVTPNPYRPGNGVLTVSFKRQNLDRVGMFLFDMHGRQVAELKAVTDIALFRVDFVWDGKTASGQTAGRGMYLVIPKVGADLRSDLAKRVYLP